MQLASPTRHSPRRLIASDLLRTPEQFTLAPSPFSNGTVLRYDNPGMPAAWPLWGLLCVLVGAVAYFIIIASPHMSVMPAALILLATGFLLMKLVHKPFIEVDRSRGTFRHGRSRLIPYLDRHGSLENACLIIQQIGWYPLSSLAGRTRGVAILFYGNGRVFALAFSPGSTIEDMKVAAESFSAQLGLEYKVGPRVVNVFL